jgi:type I restriction enzyme S subunit
MKGMFIPLPSLPEQRTIAAFLDHKCALIDTFIQKKTRLIELLKEQKQAIINRAVTKGLDPEVPMKPSGVDWLGDIPAHWEVKKLKYVAEVNPGKKKLAFFSSAVFLPMEKVGEDGTYDCSIHGKVGDLQSGYTYFEKGDVIVAKITPCFENGKGAYLKDLETEVGFGSTEFHVLRPNIKEVMPEYFHFILRSEKFRSLGEYHMVGSAGQKRVPTSFVSNFAIGLPSIEEQRAVMEFIKKESSFIDETITQIERELLLVQEYKTTLIAEAVTGKIDVRDWQAEVPFAERHENNV